MSLNVVAVIPILSSWIQLLLDSLAIIQIYNWMAMP